jgi:serine/threonine protein phosphatase PrpC
MNYQLAHYSVRGGRRSNQDRVAVAERSNAVLMVLGDGLGGHGGGEIAAEMLTQHFVKSFLAVRQPVITRPSAFLALGILQVHAAIRTRARQLDTSLQPRTTCVVCIVQDGYAYWAHVGDSRLFHFRHGKLLTRTKDHTAVEEMHHEGVLDRDEVLHHPSKSRLLKCVGSPNKPSISLGRETLLHESDHLLLCSDGLWETLSPEEMAQLLKQDSVDEALEAMLLATEQRKGPASDNVSAVCLRWQESVTRAAPLQGNEAVSVEPDQLWSDGTRWSAGAKMQTKYQEKLAQTTQEQDPRTLETRIAELEKYLKQFDSKS